MNPQELLADLTQPQIEAVTHRDGPLLVLAAAGSGKTRVITRRVAYLAMSGVHPSSILAITFTNKAANELKERIAATGVDRGAVVGTFHAVCARFLREYSDLTGVSTNYSIFDQDDRSKVIRQAMQLAQVATDQFNAGAVEGTISNAKNRLKGPSEFAPSTADWSTRTIGKVYSYYEQLLKEQNALDFDDLLMRMALLLKTNEELRSRMEERFHHVLIDEYQDTNHAQYVIARQITRNRKNICATGDPDQSIYAWRGADIHNIMEFERDYPNARVVRLEQNYRSTKAILRVADALIRQNKQRKHKDLWTENPQGVPVRVVDCSDEKEEAVFLAETISAMQQNRSMGDIAVFYRVNAMTRVLEEALRMARIPYQIARGVAFYNRKEIKDTLAYLRVVVNPADETSLLRVINEPARGIGKTTLQRLDDEARATHRSLFEVCGQADRVEAVGRSAGKVIEFARMVGRWQAYRQSPVRDLVEAVLFESGLRAMYEAGGIDSEQAANLNELITVAADYDERCPEGSLTEFLHEISLVSDVDAVEDGVGAVTLMTLHAAKGLEFPVVFIVGLEEGLLPHQRALDPTKAKPSEMEEERRLCFVGMTRAREELILSRARHRTLRGETLRMAASRFVDELPREELHKESRGDDGVYDRFDRHDGYDRYNRRAADHDEDQTAGYRDDDGGSSSASTPYGRLRKGQKVLHPRFGVGWLIWIDPSGQATRVGVRFANGTEKTLVLQYANLKVLDA